MTHSAIALSLATALLAAAAIPHARGESRVPCNTLPATVLDHARKQAPDATVKTCVKDKEGSRLEYEVETSDAGRSKDMVFDPAGNIIEVEQEIDRGALPAAVANAIRQAAQGGEAGKVESVTKFGSKSATGSDAISYETTITRNGTKREVAFRSDGTPVKPD